MRSSHDNFSIADKRTSQSIDNGSTVISQLSSQVVSEQYVRT